jgi:hypothetical protein
MQDHITCENDLPYAPYYVIMKDNFMSYWGYSEGKANMLVFCCNTLREARIVKENAKHRSDMREVCIMEAKPCVDSPYEYWQVKDESDYPNFYISGYFHKE